MLLEMLGVDLEPVLSAISAGFGVASLLAPPLLGDSLQKCGRVGAYRADGLECGLQWVVVIVEALGPEVLIVAENEGILLGQHKTDPGGCERLGIGTVTDNLVGRPPTGRRAPLLGRLGHLGEGLLELSGTLGVAVDKF